jgi:alkylation response protein AidB-like acyl-CoA dehydrogenase
MDLSFTAAEQEFRREARDWLTANMPAGTYAPPGTPEAVRESREWDRLLFEAGWSVITWPKDYGGRAASLTEWLIFEEEYHALGGPYRMSQNGISLLAPAIFAFGTEAQKQEILVPMARGDVLWAQAWSEPGAGSDLAALTSRAVAAPGGFLLRGHKIWSSHSVHADRAFGLFRTGEPGERHRGLTYLLVPLDAPGVTVSPIRRLDGVAGFAEIRFDDVFVPADCVLGEVGSGWEVAMATTSSERSFSLRSPGRFVNAADRLLSLLRDSGVPSHGDLASRVVQAWLDADAYRLRTWATAARVSRGEPVGAESSYDKLFWSELDVRICELALEVLDSVDARADAGADDEEQRRQWLERYVTALPGTIWGGTTEIQKNVLAHRALGLPRS